MNVAVVDQNTAAAMNALEHLSSHIGLSVPLNEVPRARDRVLAANLHNGADASPFLLKLSQLHRPEFYENANMEQLLLAAPQFVLGDLKADPRRAHNSIAESE